MGLMQWRIFAGWWWWGEEGLAKRAYLHSFSNASWGVPFNGPPATPRPLYVEFEQTNLKLAFAFPLPDVFNMSTVTSLPACNTLFEYK